MRLIGSFQTMVTHGVSGTASSPASSRSTSAGATLIAHHLREHNPLCQGIVAGANRAPQTRGPGRSPGSRPACGHAARRGGLARRLPPVGDDPGLTTEPASGTGLLTDHYELTMLAGALHSGAAQRRAVFEVFARQLPHGRRYGVVAGTGRLLDALERFRFGPEELAFLRDSGIVDETTLRYLSSYRFGGNIWGYAEGDVYFPGSPIIVVEGTFAEAVLLETLVLSVMNHDCAIASAASRMVTAAGGIGGRPLIEMGSRRTHELAAVAAARAAYIAGFAS